MHQSVEANMSVENMEIYKQIIDLKAKRKAAALVTVIKVKGSTPRDTGSKMIVLKDGTIFGTIGGSAVEALIIEEAKKCITSGKIMRVSHNLFDLEETDTGMLCGGTMEFFIEPLVLAPRLYIFGGGHVAQTLAKLAYEVGFDYVLIDDREEFANKERFPEATEIMVNEAGKQAANMEFEESDFVAIVTRGHKHDYETLKGVIRKNVRYLGLIGSNVKRNQLFKKLMEEGITDEQLARVHSPIGLDIEAETPQEIAVSIVAELIKIKNTNSKQGR
jgi:xanthine dehydrogenase accessory factor